MEQGRDWPTGMVCIELPASEKRWKHDISKGTGCYTEFDLSRQFGSYLVKKGAIKTPNHLSIPCPISVCALAR